MEENIPELPPSHSPKKPKISPLSEETGLKSPQVLEAYTVSLNLTDVNYGVKGHNKYYIIQVLESNGFYLWTKWGRVGASTPFTNLAPCSSKAEAIVEFKKKFRAKTKNEWGEPFHYVQGKYQVVEVHTDSKKIELHVQQEKKRRELEAAARSFPMQCEARLADLVRTIWDFDRMSRALKELNLDPDQCPLGRLSCNQIQRGYKILKEIQHVLNTSNRESQVLELTNQFYTNIPQNFGMKRPPPINHILKVREKLTLLESLQEMEIANSLSIRSLKQLETKHPVDVYYAQLKCRISPVDEEVAGMLQSWMANTRAPSHNFELNLIQAYEVQREGEAARYWPFAKLENKKLLWHGSRATNYVGILSNGLKIAPKEAPSSGYMFGKGVYMADISTKAARYCNATPDNPEGLLLLCEVALGKMHTMFRAKSYKRPPNYCHSVMGVGKNAPSETRELRNNVSVAIGGIQPNPQGAQSDLQYNEYVVYDVGQVLIRYILKVRFGFLE